MFKWQFHYSYAFVLYSIFVITRTTDYTFGDMSIENIRIDNLICKFSCFIYCISVKYGTVLQQILW